MSPADPLAAYEPQDRPAEPRLHELARLCEVPMAAVNLLDRGRIVEAHGGAIGLSPAPGGGTVAWFTLPDPS